MKTKTFFSLLIILLLLTVITTPALAMSAGASSKADTPQIPEAVLLLIPIIVGSIGIPLINFLKTQLKWTNPEDKLKNVWLSFGVSVVLAVLALLITNSLIPLTGPETLVTWISLTFTVATLMYKSMQPVPATG
jgi:hypothetical protein